MKKYDLSLPPNVITIDPVGYLEFLYLLNKCKVVLTDSGGVQEESVVLKKTMHYITTYVSEMGNHSVER